MRKIVIIGAGLSGLCSAYLISSYTNAKVTIIEQGDSYDDRLRKSSPSMISGVGGAGTVGGGKFCFPPASFGVWKKTGYSNDKFLKFLNICVKPFFNTFEFKQFPDNQRALKNLDVFEKKYNSTLLTKDELNNFVNNMLKVIKSQKVEIRTHSKFVETKNFGYQNYIVYEKDNIREIEPYDILIFATGRSSANEILNWLPYNVYLLQNPDLGIRFSLCRNESDIFNSIGKDIKLKNYYKDVCVRTFCVCSGGNKTVVELGKNKYYDGHFGEKLTNEVNIGILARSPRFYGYASAQRFCEELMDNLNSDMSMNDFIKYNKKLLPSTTQFDEIFDAISLFVNSLSDSGIIDQNLSKYPVWLPAVEHLNPVIYTTKDFKTLIKNVYVIGDAVGVSRGFIQSMWSAFCASLGIISECSQENYKLRLEGALIKN